VFFRCFLVFLAGPRARLVVAASLATGTDAPPGADAGRPARSSGSDVALEGPVDRGVTHRSVSSASNADEQAGPRLLRASYSPLDAEGETAELAPVEREWRDAAAVLVSRLQRRLSRRWRPAARGRRFDLRRTLRRSLPSAGDMLVPQWRTRRRRHPRFVLLIDGSRSMGTHSRSALKIAVALSSVTDDTETFGFSTTLGPLTRDVRRAAAGEHRRVYLRYAWGGGTQIGACLSEFVQRFAERLVDRDTAVVIASDGLDVGDPGMLRDALARLSRRSATIVWMNPLLDTAGYEPTALGMRTALPFVTMLASAVEPAGLVRLSRAMRIG
jgi:uncharacterized protein with von Willebrand factor type A (vWA) domain